MATLSPLLHRLAEARNPRLLLALRPQDPIPDWITHVLFLGKDLQVTHQGPKDEVGRRLKDDVERLQNESKPGEEMAEMPRFYNEFGRSLEKINHKPASTALRRELEGGGDAPAPTEDNGNPFNFLNQYHRLIYLSCRTCCGNGRCDSKIW